MATITGTEGPDTLIGTDADPFYGTGGDDIINGLGGNDLILPGTGHDVIDAGPGDDTIRLTAAAIGSTSIAGGSGYDTIDLGSLVTALYITAGQAPGDAGLIGTDGTNIGYYNFTAIERIFAGSGDDRISVAAMGPPPVFQAIPYVGDMEVFAGAGNDSIGGVATGRLILHGGDGNDDISVSAVAYGDAGDDAFRLSWMATTSGTGPRLLDGGSGTDIAYLYQGFDIDLAAGTVKDMSGNFLGTIAEVENVFDYTGRSILRGDDNANWLAGRTLTGGGGDDILSGQGYEAGPIDQLDGW